jgi:competence protein ComEC
MRIFSLAFLLGILALQFFSHLPNQKWVVAILLFIIFIKWMPRWLKWIAVFFLGFAWCLWFAHSQLAWELPDRLEGKMLAVTGYIASIPITAQHRTSFLFAFKKGKIRLSWQDANLKLRVGDQWHLVVRLKKIHSTSNPGGADYEAYAAEEGIRATGYVINHPQNQLISSNWYHYPLDRIRQFLFEKINENLPISNTSPWISALALGERQNISNENWEVLRNTGTNHLMAIAGLHIGLMAGFAYSFVFFFWRRIPSLMIKIPAQDAGAIASLFMALTYSALAGFSLPTQRACVMLIVFLVASLFRRHLLSWQAWSLALISVLLTNPLSVLNTSFWLSFVSVALIIYGVSGRLAATGWWWKWGRIQWVLALGLIPLSIAFFQQYSLVSFISNSIAIPWVGFLVMPLTLLGCVLLVFSTKIGIFILKTADQLLSILWKLLITLSHLPWGVWYHAPPNVGIVLLACVGITILLLPAGFPGRYLGLIWLLPLFIIKVPAPLFSEIWFTLLDVGQGLSAIIQTQKHILVFDTGVKWNDQFDMGDSVVLPFLRAQNIKNIDMLVISHEDNDHIGGSATILKQLPVLAIKTSVPDRFQYMNVSYCLRGEHWLWDGVKFEFIYPLPDKLHLDNNSSCVLRITNGYKTILLTGDIEKLAENDLVKWDGKNLAADILVAPHHGSKTSAMNEFIDDVNPSIVLFPVGYRNRYHFPHPSVLRKYQQRYIGYFDTATDGAIQYRINKTLSIPILYRVNHLHYWNS